MGKDFKFVGGLFFFSMYLIDDAEKSIMSYTVNTCS